MSYTNNANQIVCQCGKQDRLLPVLPQSSNSRMMKMMQQPGCGCMTPSSLSNSQNYYIDNQSNVSSCLYCQRIQHCCICDFSRRTGTGMINQGNMFCSCCTCPIQQLSCQCGTNYLNIQHSNPATPQQTQITEIVNSNSGNTGGNGVSNGLDSTVPSTLSPGGVLVSTNLNSVQNQGQQITTQSELSLKSTSVNPEMINIALSGQTPESLSISIDSRGVITLGVNNHPAPVSNVPTTSNEESRNRIRNALGDRH
ncbi:uncharacterized protein ELE39_002049 [Cryptosporidium sp. chipmunk genotype I]|uniref:uncharacterized protein n=1 Tax=Cryptosporidium sp. chipmunk genotype I TaxID=1280935 RepID=UPI003519E673|nr:hypothetical protein ELE39_002049 [Cryptosporidium sp. chipmunk genotype I]